MRSTQHLTHIETMTIKTKFTALLAIGIAVWQINLTGSDRRMMGCLLVPASACREGDAARQMLYFAALGGALGVLTRKTEQG